MEYYIPGGAISVYLYVYVTHYKKSEKSNCQFTTYRNFKIKRSD